MLLRQAPTFNIEPGCDLLTALAQESAATSYIPFPERVTPQALFRFHHERAAGWLSCKDCRVLFGEDAAAVWKRLDWDSVQLGFETARIEFLTARGDYNTARRSLSLLCKELLDDCGRSGIQYLTVRAAAQDLAVIHTLEENGFQLLDGIQTFSLRLERYGAFEGQHQFQAGLFESWQEDQLAELAGTAYQNDRFHADSAIPTAIADQLYRKWLRNSCTGPAADKVFVATKSGEVLGFVTVSFDKTSYEYFETRLATIVLVATKETARRCGVAQATTHQSLQWLKAQGYEAVIVGTQLGNIAAGRLYESCGFRLAAASLTFRRLL